MGNGGKPSRQAANLFACKKGEIVVVYAARVFPPALAPTN